MRRYAILAMLATGITTVPVAAQSPDVQDEINRRLAAVRGLQGVWEAHSVSIDGKPVDRGLKGYLLTFDGRRFRQTAGGKLAGEGTFWVRPGDPVSGLDLVREDRQPPDSRQLAYSLRDGTLTVCTDNATDRRPSDLKPGKDRTLIVYKRPKP